MPTAGADAVVATAGGVLGPNDVPRLDVTNAALTGISGVVADPTLTTDSAGPLNEVISAWGAKDPLWIPPGTYLLNSTIEGVYGLNIAGGSRRKSGTVGQHTGLLRNGTYLVWDVDGPGMDLSANAQAYPSYVEGLTFLNRGRTLNTTAANPSDALTYANPSGSNGAWHTTLVQCQFGLGGVTAFTDTQTTTVAGSNVINTSTSGGYGVGIATPTVGEHVSNAQFPSGTTVVQVLSSSSVLLSDPAAGNASSQTVVFHGLCNWQVCGPEVGGTTFAVIEGCDMFGDAPSYACFYSGNVAASGVIVKDSTAGFADTQAGGNGIAPYLVDGIGVACRFSNCMPTNPVGNGIGYRLNGAQELVIGDVDMEVATGNLPTAGAIDVNNTLSALGGSSGRNISNPGGCGSLQLTNMQVESVNVAGTLTRLVLGPNCLPGNTAASIVVDTQNVFSVDIHPMGGGFSPGGKPYIDAWPSTRLRMAEPQVDTQTIAVGGTYTVTPGDSVLVITTTGAPASGGLILPAASAVPIGWTFLIKNVASSTNALPITTAGGTLPAGLSPLAAGSSVKISSDHTNYIAG